MKGIIFAAGLGSRLRPITDKTPKPLVKINGKEILSFILDAFEKGGIKNVIICMGYKKETIKNFCRDYQRLVCPVPIEDCPPDGPGCDYDLDGNLIVDGFDIQILRLNLGECVP